MTASAQGFDAWWKSFPAGSSEHPETLSDRDFAKAAWHAALTQPAGDAVPFAWLGCKSIGGGSFEWLTIFAPPDAADVATFDYWAPVFTTPPAAASDARDAFNVGDRVLWTDACGKQYPATIVKFNPATYDAEVDGGFDTDCYPATRYAALTPQEQPNG